MICRRERLCIAVVMFFVTRALYAADCAPAPLRDSQHAICYAVTYAERNGLSHGRVFKRTVAKGAKVWTVRFLNTRRGAGERGWEVEIEPKSGNVVRFTSYKPVSPK
ncbi:MAG: hypothetical protein ABR570_14140 [Burkholderiales bacterium]